MKYIIVDSNLVDLSIFQQDLVRILIEIDNEGHVNREIGYNKIGEVVHAFPAKKFKYGKYGIFDLNLFDKSSGLDDDNNIIDFENEWNKIST
jgi:hypothetical protein